jgi:hypothetical protein
VRVFKSMEPLFLIADLSWSTGPPMALASVDAIAARVDSVGRAAGRAGPVCR